MLKSFYSQHHEFLIKLTNRSTNEEIIMEKISLIIGGIHLVYYFPRSPEQFTEPIINWEAFESFILFVLSDTSVRIKLF